MCTWCVCALHITTKIDRLVELKINSSEYFKLIQKITTVWINRTF